MKRRLFIADVHANLPAFEAVLQVVGAVDEVIFLGDIVGYGPHPAECIDLLQGMDALAIAGNHDLEVLAVSPRPDAPGEPVNWLQWTRRQVSDTQMAFLGALPTELSVGAGGAEMQIVHHPPGAPYLHPQMPDSVLVEQCASVAGATVVFGHSHRSFDREVAGRRLICVPSVGQPRDADPRASYALESGGQFSFHRVPYDVEVTAKDVRAIGLDPDFTERWCSFVRTGHDAEWSRDLRVAPSPSSTAQLYS